MTERNRPVDRRTVLRGAGGAVGAAVGLAGTAAASDFAPGDCAVTVHESLAYDTACPTGSHSGYVDRDVTGQVLNTCTASDGEEWAYFSPGRTIEPVHWVRESNLEHC